MLKKVRGLLKRVVPPIAWDTAHSLKEGIKTPTSGWFVEGAGASAFARSPPQWEGAQINQAYERRWPLFEQVRSTPVPPVFASELESSAFDPRTELFSADNLLRHNAVLGLVFAAARAARQRPAISLLDWGGGVGHQYGLLRALLPDLKLDCTCFDLPTSVAFGSKRFPEVSFTSDFSCLEKMYDLVVANNSLHYFEDWEGVVGKLADAAKDYLFLTMVPVILDGHSQVMSQRWLNPDGTSYSGPEWFISRDELLRQVPNERWKLQRELICGYSPKVHGSGARADYRGFLFERVNMKHP